MHRSAVLCQSISRGPLAARPPAGPKRQACRNVRHILLFLLARLSGSLPARISLRTSRLARRTRPPPADARDAPARPMVIGDRQPCVPGTIMPPHGRRLAPSGTRWSAARLFALPDPKCLGRFQPPANSALCASSGISRRQVARWLDPMAPVFAPPRVPCGLGPEH